MDNVEPIIRKRDGHCISRRHIDADALKVLYRLARRGHTAYLVGGGVRDLLLDLTPKDFDVSTDASPSQIKKMFRNCFLIGRRFRLAHIKYGDKIIETSTFRAQPQTNGDGLLQTDDNEFGSPAEDANRRDFTINGLFYDIESFSVIDYVGGLEDLEKKSIRSIGDPAIRFQEDPVRMIRAVRFAARLGFEIEEETFNAIVEYGEEMQKAAPPRLLEEIYKLFAFRSAEASFRLLYKTKLLKIIFPEIHEYLEELDNPDAATLWDSLAALDKGDLVVNEITSALMLSAVFYPAIRHKANKADSALTQKALLEGFVYYADNFLTTLKGPKRLRDRLMRIITTQHRFMSRGKKNFSKARFVAQDWFPEALALYEIYLTSTHKDFSRANDWRALWEEKVVSAENGESSETRPVATKKRRRRRRPRKNRGEAGVNNEQTEVKTSAEGDDATKVAGNIEPQKPEVKKTEEEKTEVAKKVSKSKRPRRKKIRHKDKDKQILEDNRPADVGPSFDQNSQAPHWLDEI